MSDINKIMEAYLGMVSSRAELDESSCGTGKKSYKEGQEECPKCEGKGCDHCDDKGYHDVSEKKLDPVDFVIIEGFKTHWHPKIETYLSGNSHEPLIATSKNIIGLVHDLDYFEGEQEHFRFEEIEKIVNFVICNAVEIDQLVNDVK